MIKESLRITFYLTVAEKNALRRVARRNLRNAEPQAHYIIREALIDLGELKREDLENTESDGIAE
jgi:hypothetical protein